MIDWLRRTWSRARTDSPRRALRAGAHDAAAGTVGRAASAVYRQRAEPTPIWERDWDVLCLLDGCRVDLLCEAAPAHDFLPAPADVGTIWSVGSQSAEWMARTFAPEYEAEMRRTAYLTGNPFTGQDGEVIESVDTDPLPLSPADFAVLYEPWREEWHDGDISTIPPEPLTEAAVATWRRREALGVDRIVVHYMQPHAPFRSRPDWFIGAADTDDWGSFAEDDDASDPDETPDPDEVPVEELDEETRELLEAFETPSEDFRDPWTRRRDGELPAGELWRAYRDNLEWVLEDVARLLENCEARVAISSDHGNAAGEFGVWSHPPAVHLPSLRRVPWIEIRGEDRHTVESGLPPGIDDGDAAGVGGTRPDADVEERLADLGYR